MRRIIACHFAGNGTGERWPRMARTFTYSARVHCADWQLTIAKLPTPQRAPSATDSHTANTAKLEYWCDQVAACADGDEVLLIDVDTAILRPLDDVWAQPFDIAYTVRPSGYPHPLNGGVVFLRVSLTARLFMAAWRTRNREMLNDRALRDHWRKYAGINQRALGSLLEERPNDFGHLLTLPCAEWNCEDSTWSSFDPTTTRIMHIKSALRSTIFDSPGRPPLKPHLRTLARRWSAIEQQAQLAEVARP